MTKGRKIYSKSFKQKAVEWIETWYNKHRRHNALNNLTIHEFELVTNLKKVA